MAKSGDVISRVSEAADVLPSAIDRLLRYLRDENMAPSASPGPQKVNGLYDHRHMTNVVLGLAGHLPSDAAVAARLLRDTECEAIPPADDADPLWSWLLKAARPPVQADYDGTEEGSGRISGGAWLDSLVLILARMTHQEREQFVEICEIQGAELSLGLSPATVTILWDTSKVRKEVSYSSGDTPLHRIFSGGSFKAPRRRFTVFPLTILAVAGELAADAVERASASLDFPPSGSTPESKEAPAPARASASIVPKSRVERLTRPLDKAEVRWRRANAQARRATRGSIHHEDGASDREIRP